MGGVIKGVEGMGRVGIRERNDIKSRNLRTRREKKRKAEERREKGSSRNGNEKEREKS